MATDPSPTSSDRLLVEDLRTLTTLRSRTAVRDRPLPALRALLPEAEAANADVRVSALQELIDDAVAALRDPSYRHAATALLGSGSNRWRPVKERGAEAAVAFGCGWDAFRRRNSATGTSRLDETIQALAVTLSERAGTTTGPGEGAAAAATPAPTEDDDSKAAVVVIDGPAEPIVETVPPQQGPSRRVAARRRLTVGIALLVVAAAAATVAVAGWNRDSEEASATGPTPTGCKLFDDSPGDLPTGADETLANWSAAFALAGDSVEPDLCAQPMVHQAGAVVQRTESPTGGGRGALVGAADGETVVALDDGEFNRFEAHHLKEPSPTARLGLPVSRADRPDGTRVVEFTNGVIVSTDPRRPAITVIGRFWERWIALGGLERVGAPLTPRYGVAHGGDLQEFATGDLAADYRTGEVTWRPSEPADRVLPAEVTERVLVSGGGVSWYIDRNDDRHWIPSDAAWSCALNAVVPEETRGVRAVALEALDLGEVFSC